MRVVRSSFEFAVRAFWVLNPSASHRVRCARAALAEVVSTQMVRCAASKLPDAPDVCAARHRLRADAKAQTARLRELFASVGGRRGRRSPEVDDRGRSLPVLDGRCRRLDRCREHWRIGRRDVRPALHSRASPGVHGHGGPGAGSGRRHPHDPRDRNGPCDQGCSLVRDADLGPVRIVAGSAGAEVEAT